MSIQPTNSGIRSAAVAASVTQTPAQQISNLLNQVTSYVNQIVPGQPNPTLMSNIHQIIGDPQEYDGGGAVGGQIDPIAHASFPNQEDEINFSMNVIMQAVGDLMGGGNPGNDKGSIAYQIQLIEKAIGL